MRSRGTQGIVATVVALLALAAVALAGNRIECPGAGMNCDGTTGNDILVGTAEIDHQFGDDGNDRLRGRGSFDELQGENGNDILDGGKGPDSYQFYGDAWGEDRIIRDAGGADDNLIFFPSTATPILVDLQHRPGRTEVSYGLNSIEIAKGVVFERVQASEGQDVLKGGPAAEQLGGGDDDDKVVGRGGDDNLIGDFDVFTDVGNDIIVGGAGRDRFTGGDGDDTIKAKDGEKDQIDCGDGTDTVTYDHGLDKLKNNCEV